MLSSCWVLSHTTLTITLWSLPLLVCAPPNSCQPVNQTHVLSCSQHTCMHTSCTWPLPFLLVITSGCDGRRAGWRVAVGWGEVEVAGIDSLLKVKWRVVFLQRLHIHSRCLERLAPLCCRHHYLSKVLIVCMWSRHVLVVPVFPCRKAHLSLELNCREIHSQKCMYAKGKKFCTSF